MKTIILEKKDYNSLSVSVDDDAKVLSITGYRVGETQGGCTLQVVTPGFVYSVDIDTTDNVTISGSAFSGTKAQLETAINTLMLSNPSGGSGGGGTVGTPQTWNINKTAGAITINAVAVSNSYTYSILEDTRYNKVFIRSDVDSVNYEINTDLDTITINVNGTITNFSGDCTALKTQLLTDVFTDIPPTVKELMGAITQSGADAPTWASLDRSNNPNPWLNTLSELPTISRSDVGQYEITCVAEEFTFGKTMIAPFGDFQGAQQMWMPVINYSTGAVMGYYMIWPSSTFAIRIECKDATGAMADMSSIGLGGGSIHFHVRVFP